MWFVPFLPVLVVATVSALVARAHLRGELTRFDALPAPGEQDARSGNAG